MNLIALAKIQISPQRQRRDFDPESLNLLAESIRCRGLFHPVVLRPEGDSWFLVAGERRLRAISDLHALGTPFHHDEELIPAPLVPYVSLGDLSELDREEAELEENCIRQDLTWQELAAANGRLMELRKQQATAKGLPPPTPATIAAEVRGVATKSFAETVRRQTIVAQHLDNPVVAAAKTVDEAFKFLKHSETQQKQREHAEIVGRTFTADVHQILNANSLEWLASCPAESFDVILTDPPYGMGADDFGDAAGVVGAGALADGGSHTYEDTLENWRDILDVLETHLYRITKPLAHLYFFCDFDRFHEAAERFAEAGWWVHRTPLIWDKVHGSRVPWPSHGPRRTYELILYAVKGKKLVNQIAPDIIACRSDSNLGHAAQKPVALFAELLKRSVQPGMTILDPFCGTGPIFEAANLHNCAATGIELDPAHYSLAVRRVEALKAQLVLGV